MKRFRWSLIAPVVLAGALASLHVQAADEAGRYYEDALVRFERKDDAGAIIQLKNALKADPGLLAAHMLLGRASLRNGDYAAAEVALREAKRRGIAPAEYAVPLGNLLIDIGHQKELLDTIPASDLPPAIQLEVLLLRARAHLELNQYPQAKATLEGARRSHPGAVPVLTMQALAALQTGHGEEARTFAEEATALAPSDSGAWTSRASVAYASGDLNGALGFYEKALNLNAQNPEALLGKGSVLMDLRRMGEAKTLFEALSRVDPKEPRSAYLRAVIATAEGRPEAARRLLSDVVNLIDPAPRAALTSRSHLVLIAGLAHYSLGSAAKAKDYLELYARAFPTQAGARKPLASIYLAEGDAARAAATLEPVIRRNGNDPEMLSLLASAYGQLKRHQRASELLEEAARLNQDPAVRTSLGLSLIGARQTELGLEQLRGVLKDDPGQARASIALALKALREQQPQKAVKLMDAVIKREPGNLAALNLSGAAKAAAGDFPGARTAYEKVLAADKGVDSAVLNLARLDVAERRPDQARGRLDDLLKRVPDHPAALYERAMLDVGQRRPAEAIRQLQNLLDKHRDHVEGRIALIDIYLDEGDLDQALKHAQGSAPSRPGYIPLQAALARVQLARNDLAGARATLTALTRVADFESIPQYKIALLQRMAGNPAGAAYSLEKALQGDPTFTPAKVMLGELELAEGKVDAAGNRVRDLLKSPSATPAAFQLAGDVELARGRYPEALKHYGAALSRGAGGETAARLYGAHVRGGSAAQGLAALERLARERKGDRVVRMVLSSALTEAGRLKDAKTVLDELLKEGEDPVLLNNLANLQLKLKDAGAQQSAERAHALLPNAPIVLDTLGWILVQKGQIDAGLKYLREARLRDPSNGEIRLHLAVALANAGRKAEARAELKEALTLSGDLAASEHARALQRELGLN